MTIHFNSFPIICLNEDLAPSQGIFNISFLENGATNRYGDMGRAWCNDISFDYIDSNQN